MYSFRRPEESTDAENEAKYVFQHFYTDLNTNNYLDRPGSICLFPVHFYCHSIRRGTHACIYSDATRPRMQRIMLNMCFNMFKGSGIELTTTTTTKHHDYEHDFQQQTPATNNQPPTTKLVHSIPDLFETVYKLLA